MSNKRDRYFALVLAVPDCDMPLLSASTEVGDMFRVALTQMLLPEGAKITRSIEITKEYAVNGIR